MPARAEHRGLELDAPGDAEDVAVERAHLQLGAWRTPGRTRRDTHHGLAVRGDDVGLIGDDPVVTGAAVHEVAALRDRADGVVAGATAELLHAVAAVGEMVVARSAVQPVDARSTVQVVVAVVSAELISIRPALDDVVAGATKDPIAARLAGQPIVALIAVDHVSATTRAHPVVARTRVNHLGAVGPADPVSGNGSGDRRELDGPRDRHPRWNTPSPPRA